MPRLLARLGGRPKNGAVTRPAATSSTGIHNVPPGSRRRASAWRQTIGDSGIRSAGISFALALDDGRVYGRAGRVEDGEAAARGGVAVGQPDARRLPIAGVDEGEDDRLPAVDRSIQPLDVLDRHAAAFDEAVAAGHLGIDARGVGPGPADGGVEQGRVARPVRSAAPRTARADAATSA